MTEDIDAELAKIEEEIKEYKKSICKVIDDFILNDKDFRDVHASYQLEHYMNYHYTKDVVVSGTLGSIFLSVSWLTPNFLGFIFAPRS